MEPSTKGLDALRGVLALTVFVCHSIIIFIKPLAPSLADAAGYSAHAAVMFFFALSGYVITLSIDRNRRHGFSGRLYALSRIARLVPPLIAAIAVASAASALLQICGLDVAPESMERSLYRTDPAKQLMSIATLGIRGDITGAGLNGPLWTLSYEIQLYVMAGLVAAIVFGGLTMKVVAALTLAAYLLVAPLSPLSNMQLFDARITVIAAFFCGSLAYLLRKHNVGLALYGLAVIGMMGVVTVMQPTDEPTGHARLLLYEVAMSGLCCLVIILIARTGSLCNWQRLGECSYTLYVLHYPLLLVPAFVLANEAPHHAESPWIVLVWLTTVGAVYIVSATVARVVEQPKQHRAFLCRWFRVHVTDAAESGGVKLPT